MPRGTFCVMIGAYFGHRPAGCGFVTHVLAGLSFFVVPSTQVVNAGGDAQQYGRGNATQMPQLASILKEKRQAARRSTHNGSDDAKWRKKPKQRASNRSRKHGYVLVHPVSKSTKFANCAKRLIPYSERELQTPPQYGEGSRGAS